MSLETVVRVVRSRIQAIQATHNFNPAVGAEQVQQEDAQSYGAFRELLYLIDRARLNVVVPYDENEDAAVPLRDRTHYIYFDRLRDDPGVWKLGRSHIPFKRRQNMQTSNHQAIVVRKTVAVGTLARAMLIEGKVKHYLRKYLTGNGGGTEWANLTDYRVSLICAGIQSGDLTFLDKPLPKRRHDRREDV